MDEYAAPAEFASGVVLTEDEKYVIENKGTEGKRRSGSNPGLLAAHLFKPRTHILLERSGRHGQVRQVLPDRGLFRVSQVRRTDLLVPGQV